MINLQLSVREAMNLATNCNLEIYERIVTAFEVALGVNQNKTVTITGGMTLDNRIPCIKAIRAATGWGLKESKDWTDVFTGGFQGDRHVAGNPNAKQSITLNTPEKALFLLREMRDLGCEGFLS